MDLVGKRRFVPAWLLCASCSSAHGLVTIERVTVNGTVSKSIAANCIELAPQVRHCTEADVSGKDLAVRVQTTFEPRECGQRVESESFILMHYTGRVLDSASGETGQPFVSVHDFTAASPIALGSPQTIRGWTYALEGMCERQRATITLPPELAHGGNVSAGIPADSRVEYEVEIVVVLDQAANGRPMRPNVFAIIDADGNAYLDEAEVQRHFGWLRRDVPPDLFRAQDGDRDGRISWDEFSGPKGPRPKDEL